MNKTNPIKEKQSKLPLVKFYQTFSLNPPFYCVNSIIIKQMNTELLNIIKETKENQAATSVMG